MAIKLNDRVVLNRDVLKHHARSVPAHLGYSREQFMWRNTLRELLGLDKDYSQVVPPMVGVVSRLFENSDHVNVDFGTHSIGISSKELVIAR